jgi:hypothetical protein
MWNPRWRWGRRRRNPAGAAVAILLALCYVGYDQWVTSAQTREEFTGTIARVYDHKPFFSGRDSVGERYWDVRTAEGDVHSVRIRPRSLWSDARPGDRVVKRAGEANPGLIGQR